MRHGNVVRGLTPARERMLERIEQLIERNGYPPSITELVESTGNGRATVHRVLGLLEREGYIERLGPRRLIRLTRPSERTAA
jgi:DNA-binding IclR family transcriptional regulator